MKPSFNCFNDGEVQTSSAFLLFILLDPLYFRHERRCTAKKWSKRCSKLWTEIMSGLHESASRGPTQALAQIAGQSVGRSRLATLGHEKKSNVPRIDSSWPISPKSPFPHLSGCEKSFSPHFLNPSHATFHTLAETPQGGGGEATCASNDAKGTATKLDVQRKDLRIDMHLQNER